MTTSFPFWAGIRFDSGTDGAPTCHFVNLEPALDIGRVERQRGPKALDANRTIGVAVEQGTLRGARLPVRR